VGYEPGSSIRDAVDFEDSLKMAVSKGFNNFIQLIPGFRFSHDGRGGLHESVIKWLKLVFIVLSEQQSAKALLQTNTLLFEPQYKPTILEQLKTKGIIVPGIIGTVVKPEVKPLLMLHVEGVGIILLCLLFYRAGECMAYFGGLISEGGSLSDVSPCQNLPVNDRQVLCGAVSKHLDIEDFIKCTAIGVYIKSSCYKPGVSELGSLYSLEPRKFYPNEHSTIKKMSVVGMTTRLMHGPGMQPTRPFNWNAGYDAPLYTEGKVKEQQEKIARPLPAHVWLALGNARQQVLENGFRDADVPDAEKFRLLPKEMPPTLSLEICQVATSGSLLFQSQTPVTFVANVGTPETAGSRKRLHGKVRCSNRHLTCSKLGKESGH
jgi:hypothetical protein